MLLGSFRGVVTLDVLLEQIEAMDNDNKARFEKTEARFVKIENSLCKSNKEALSREADMEVRILKSINDQVNVAMTAVQAMNLKDLTEKMEHMEFRIGQLREGSSTSSPSYQSIDGYGMLNGQKGGAREVIPRVKVQAPR
jgi:hypothetical protein